MQKLADDRLVAYLDGEIDAAERHEVESGLATDPDAAERLARFAHSAQLLRQAFDETIHEPVPERLLAAARGGKIGSMAPVAAMPRRRRAAPRGAWSWRRWPVALPIAASLCGLILGGGASYFGVGELGGAPLAPGQPALEAAAANNVWLDNAAGYFKLYVSAGDSALGAMPAGDPNAALQRISQALPHEVRLPDLKPWGLTFRGARLVVVEGRPAAQLVYTSSNKAIGPLALIIGSSRQPDIPPTFDRRQNVNLLYWRHQGRAYALVGEADIGYLWGIGNDVAWQLDAI